MTARRYFLTLSYAGAAYSGWQRQQSVLSVQQVVEEALQLILGKETKIVGSSRTDAGVHALGQVAHFDSSSELCPQNFLYKINGLLPPKVAVSSLQPVRPTAHARYDAQSRRYVYRVHSEKQPLLAGCSYYCPYQLNVEAMNRAARMCLRHSDFQAFASRSGTARPLSLPATAGPTGTEKAKKLLFSTTANRFLRSMVRTMVGTCIENRPKSFAGFTDK